MDSVQLFAYMYSFFIISGVNVHCKENEMTKVVYVNNV